MKGIRMLLGVLVIALPLLLVVAIDQGAWRAAAGTAVAYAVVLLGAWLTHRPQGERR
jgi:hypothetical protein